MRGLGNMSAGRLARRAPLLIVCLIYRPFPLLTGNGYYQNMVIISLVIAVGAVGLNIITGFAGYPSLAQGAFIGVGAYTAAIGSVKIGRLPLLLDPPGRSLGRLLRLSFRALVSAHPGILFCHHHRVASCFWCA